MLRGAGAPAGLPAVRWQRTPPENKEGEKTVRFLNVLYV